MHSRRNVSKVIYSNLFWLFPFLLFTQPIPWWEASPPNTRLTEQNMTEQPNSGQSDTPHKPTEDGSSRKRRRRVKGSLGCLFWGEGVLFLSQIFSTLLSGIFFASWLSYLQKRGNKGTQWKGSDESASFLFFKKKNIVNWKLNSTYNSVHVETSAASIVKIFVKAQECTVKHATHPSAFIA